MSSLRYFKDKEYLLLIVNLNEYSFYFPFNHGIISILSSVFESFIFKVIKLYFIYLNFKIFFNFFFYKFISKKNLSILINYYKILNYLF